MKNQTLLAAAVHPTRVDILVDLSREDNLSPRMFAERHNDEIERVAYHFRVLRDRGLIKLAKTRPVRGTVEHFYVLSKQGRIGFERLCALLELA